MPPSPPPPGGTASSAGGPPPPPPPGGTPPPPPPGGTPPPPPPEPEPAPGLGEQIGATRDSAKRLFDAHLELARAEIEEIGGAVKRATAFGGLAVGLVVFAVLLLGIGLPLFLGEWIFGSIGWGLLLGLLALCAGALAAVLVALEPGVDPHIRRSFTIALVVGVVFALLAGAGVTNRAWSTLADAVAGSVEAGVRPLAMAAFMVGLVGAVIGLVVGYSRGGSGAGVGGLVVGAILGITIGALTALDPGWRVGSALGLEIGLIVWIVLMVRTVAGGDFDSDKLKARYWPARTIETTKETIEWARERMPLSKRS